MMNTKFFPLFLTTLLVSTYPTVEIVQAETSQEVTQSIWKPFSSTEGSFSILMPGKPRQVRQTLNTPNGTITLKGFMVQRRDEANYLVIYTDLSSKTITNDDDDVNKLFDEITEGFVRRTRSSLIAKEDIALNDYPGREIYLQISGSTIARSRMFLINRRLYQLVAITSREQDLPQSIQGFLDSFQYTPRVARRTTQPERRTTEPERRTNVPDRTTTVPKEDLNTLNTQLRQAVCGQKLSQAIKILERMIAIAPNASEERSQLVEYRRRLQDMADSTIEIPPDAFPDCQTDTPESN